MPEIPDDIRELDGVITDPEILEARRKEFVNETSERIAKYGYTMQGVLDIPPFVYTVGLTMRDLPELYVTGLEFSTAQYVLAECVTLLEAGNLAVGQEIHEVLADGYTLMPIEMDDLSQLTMARMFAAHAPMRAIQIVWPDAERRFPWDDGYDIAPVDPDWQVLRGAAP